MSLPKIEQPITKIEIPSTKKQSVFRPFLVKEEKILLMAKESQDPSDILTAIKQIVTNCSLDPTVTIDKLTIFDLEYIYLKLRAISINNIIKVFVKDFEDNKDYELEVNLNDVKVEFPEKYENKIKISDKSGIFMKYPPSTLYNDSEYLNSQDDFLFNLIVRCIDKIYDGENIYEASNYSTKELSEFLENLNLKTYEQIKTFLNSTPKLKYVGEYKNSLNNDKKVEFNSLNDFFTFR
jgi:hypothetical protein